MWYQWGKFGLLVLFIHVNGKMVNRGQRRHRRRNWKKKIIILQIWGLIRFSVSLQNAEFDLFIFTDCRPFILTQGLFKIDTKGKYLNFFYPCLEQTFVGVISSWLLGSFSVFLVCISEAFSTTAVQLPTCSVVSQRWILIYIYCSSSRIYFNYFWFFPEDLPPTMLSLVT